MTHVNKQLEEKIEELRKQDIYEVETSVHYIDSPDFRDIAFKEFERGFQLVGLPSEKCGNCGKYTVNFYKPGPVCW